MRGSRARAALRRSSTALHVRLKIHRNTSNSSKIHRNSSEFVKNRQFVSANPLRAIHNLRTKAAQAAPVMRGSRARAALRRSSTARKVLGWVRTCERWCTSRGVDGNSEECDRMIRPDTLQKFVKRATRTTDSKTAATANAMELCIEPYYVCTTWQFGDDRIKGNSWRVKRVRRLGIGVAK